MPDGGDGTPFPMRAGGSGSPPPNAPHGPPRVPREALRDGAGSNLLFLREEELRLAQDLLFFGYRDFTAGADAILAELGLGRAHHRVLHFVSRRPGLTVGKLLCVLGITKQSLARVLTPLVEGGLVTQAAGRSDRRQRLLRLTETGATLERRLFERQRDTITRAYREAGPDAVDGFRRVMRGLMGPDARGLLDGTEARPVQRLNQSPGQSPGQRPDQGSDQRPDQRAEQHPDPQHSAPWPGPARPGPAR